MEEVSFNKVEEAESHENSQVEHHVDEEEIRRKKAGRW